jgi:hypothetical protein
LKPLLEYGKAEPAAQPQGAAPSEPVTGLRDQLAEQRRYAEQYALHQYIASNFPGALPHDTQWLMANPHHLQNPMLVHQAAKIAADRGIPRNDPQFLQFVGQLLDQHAAAQMRPAPAPPMPPPMSPMPAPPIRHVDVSKTENADTGEPEAESVAMHHVSAPVSRGSERGSVEPEPTASSITLTPAQRDHAHAAGVSDVEYAKQLLKMQKAKRAGLIKD